MNKHGRGNSLRQVLLLTLFALVVSSGAVLAQRGGRGGGGGGRMDPEQMRERMQERAEQQYKEMCETLKLDDTQQHQADSLHAIVVKQRQELFEKYQGQDNAREGFEKLREVQDNFHTELKKILSDDQKEQLELILKEIQEQMQERRSNRRQ